MWKLYFSAGAFGLFSWANFLCLGFALGIDYMLKGAFFGESNLLPIALGFFGGTCLMAGISISHCTRNPAWALPCLLLIVTGIVSCLQGLSAFMSHQHQNFAFGSAAIWGMMLSRIIIEQVFHLLFCYRVALDQRMLAEA